MEVYIILALVLALLQIWIIPMVLNSSNLEWMLSNREEVLDDSPVLIRSRKAYANLQETLPIFLALALLSMIKGIDVTDMACWWLVFRGVHGISYMAGATYMRTLSWFGALGALIGMAVQIIQFS
jgi:uncharacterized MAPEG superfamily protein|tara:strand:+ start:5666 stop:6040 length:375 start_codon:yes stop_codon:yes gene_type:complete